MGGHIPDRFEPSLRPPRPPEIPETMYFLVIDCGTSTCRAAVISDRGNIISQSRLPIRIEQPKPLFAEIDTQHLWRQVQKLILSENEKHPGMRFDAVGISTMLGYVFLDKADKPLMPAIIYMDNRAAVESEEIRQLISETVFYSVTGRRVSPLLLAPKIKWLAKNRPDVFNRLECIIGLKDEIIRRLTGNIQTDIAHLDYSGLYNVHRAELDNDLLDALEIKKSLFPSSGPAFAIAGTVMARVGGKLGLTPGTPVVTGSSDGTTAMYGAGVLEEGNAVLVSGTTDVLMLCTDTAIEDATRSLSLNSGILPKTFLVGGPLGSSGGSLHYFEELLNTSVGKLEDKIAALPPGSNGLLFFPGFTGERSPYWKEHLTGGIVGLTFEHKQQHLLRAIMEGCALRILRLLEIFSQNGLNPRTLTIVGGGSGVDIWNQIRCDATGLEVRKPAVTEATCLGTALFCRAGLDSTRSFHEIAGEWLREVKRYIPRENHTIVYRKLAILFNNFIAINEDIYQNLSDMKLQDF